PNLPDRGSVGVTTSVRPNRGVLTVDNSGENLAPEVVATLAEPFHRGVERIRTDHAGVGLGLAIVKSITQAHDGTLTLAPRPDGGLRVTVELPAAPCADTDSESLSLAGRRRHDQGETSRNDGSTAGQRRHRRRRPTGHGRVLSRAGSRARTAGRGGRRVGRAR